MAKRTIFLVVHLLGVVAALLTANRPRFWWQELFLNCALYWVVPAFLLGVYLLINALRNSQRSLLIILVSCSYLYAAAVVSGRALPYLHFDRNRVLDSSDMIEVKALWIDRWGDAENVGALGHVIQRYNPTIVVVSGRGIDTLSTATVMAPYPFRITLHDEASDEIGVFATKPLGETGIYQLGLKSHVGGFLTLHITPERVIELGVLALSTADTAADFERNRISSRRLASCIRNSKESRLVLGDFSSTPFSQLVSVYSDQAGVRSLRFGLGLSDFIRSVAFGGHGAPAQVFASKDLSWRAFEDFQISGRSRRGVFFEVGVPKAS